MFYLNKKPIFRGLRAILCANRVSGACNCTGNLLGGIFHPRKHATYVRRGVFVKFKSLGQSRLSRSMQTVRQKHVFFFLPIQSGDNLCTHCRAYDIMICRHALHNALNSL